MDNPFRKLLDVSTPLGPDTPVWPGDQPFRRQEQSAEVAGPAGRSLRVRVSSLSLSAHTGTHVDAPAHFLPDGETMASVAPEKLVLPAVVVDATGRDLLGPDVLSGVDVPAGGAVLFRTDNSRRDWTVRQPFQPDFCLTDELARRLAAANVSAVGVDGPSVDAFHSPDHAVHDRLLRAGVLLLEGLRLRDAPPGECVLLCLPLSVPAAEGAPARVLLGWT